MQKHIFYLCIFVFCMQGDKIFLDGHSYSMNIELFRFFIVGVWLADIEASPRTQYQGPSILDKIRNLDFGKKTLVYLVLFLIISLELNDIFRKQVDPAEKHRWIYYNLAPVSLVIMALTSNHLQQILNFAPFQYLGRISYGFYLSQQIPIEFVYINLTYDHIPNREKWWFKRNAIIVTVAVNLFMGHIVTKFVDDPVKDFVFRFDVLMRRKNDKKSLLNNKSAE